MMRWGLRVVLACGLAGCSATQRGSPPVAVASATPIPTHVATRSCIDLSRIREARVVDDRTIDFYMTDREVLRNSLPNSCPSLGFEKAFTYATSLSQLCSVDIIKVIVQGGGPQIGASCGLGTFTLFTPPTKH